MNNNNDMDFLFKIIIIGISFFKLEATLVLEKLIYYPDFQKMSSQNNQNQL